MVDDCTTIQEKLLAATTLLPIGKAGKAIRAAEEAAEAANAGRKMVEKEVAKDVGKGAGNTINGIPKYSLSDVEARTWYLEQESKIPSLLNKNATLEQ
ncbi:hypothetical protein ACFPVX_21720 [Cohnella faecalis]|uniref:Uncharacterized protein n=1 Tax=Cohnella faecalis TaxID=2315694 RepID=A0A398CRL0_9BACL|nr:hypothetical protein [Cohnella faecalis]RIE05182.1 hypothetical protein D3H35_02090 [Cohnella faecalis]